MVRFYQKLNKTNTKSRGVKKCIDASVNISMHLDNADLEENTSACKTLYEN